MAQGIGKIIEVNLDGAKISCPAGLRPAPGQYLAASSLDPSEPLPAALFPKGYSRGDLSIAGPLPDSWKIGLELTLRGPLGKGFTMSPLARRVGLASLGGSPARLLPLINQALSQQASIAIYTSHAPPGLPEEIEILPLDLLPEAPQWADFLALDVPQPCLGELRKRLGLVPHQRLSCPAQVLVTTAMPCAGLASCGVCAVSTRRGWVLACEDGPVFDFDQLELSF